MNLKENLKRIRKENNLSQEQLADKLNVSRQSVSKWESGTSYPEMDKMIQLCRMFDLNIDELLNQDIKKVREEKNSKIDINKYIDSFLHFVSKSYDMLNSMTKTQVLRCILEQIFFMLVFYCLSLIVIGVVKGLFGNILDVFNYHNILRKVFDLIIIFLKTGFLILDFILVIYVYKIRYLDYYLKDEKKEEVKREKPELKNEEKYSPEKIEKVIIRDPKHSEYRFISGLLRLLSLFIKCFITLMLLFAVFVLLTLLVFLVLSFMFVKTGLLFIGGFIVLISSIIILLVFISSLYCFVINRKYNYRFMERTLLVSIITLGLGFGLSFLSITNFEFKNDKVEEEIIIPMNENLSLGYVNYEEENRSDLRVVSTHSKYFKLKYDSDINWLYNDYINEDRFDEFRNIVKDINNKKIIDYGTNYITIYASKENIDKLLEKSGY
ncbi:MAG: helix-turn-helix transcriptional regulator [Bacilli bacterium]|nr:helix-turn-helix transcriptional regulator [Bacilli bacterium]